MIVNFDGSNRRPWHGRDEPTRSSPPEVRPDLSARGANPLGRREQHLSALASRLFAVKGGAMDCPYTFMQDMVAGTFRLPWEDQVKVTTAPSCGFPVPSASLGPRTAKGPNNPS